MSLSSQARALFLVFLGTWSQCLSLIIYSWPSSIGSSSGVLAEELPSSPPSSAPSAGKKIRTELIFTDVAPDVSAALDRAAMYLLEVLQLVFFDGRGLQGMKTLDPYSGVRNFVAMYREEGGPSLRELHPDAQFLDIGAATSVGNALLEQSRDNDKAAAPKPEDVAVEATKEGKKGQDGETASTGAEKTTLAYPPGHVRFCFLGLGDTSALVLQRLMLVFPQFHFVVIDLDFDVDFLKYLQSGFPNTALQVHHEDDTHSEGGIEGKCDVLAFGRDTHRFTFRKLQPLVKDPTVVLWLTDGCGRFSLAPPEMNDADANEIAVQQQCQFTYSQWRSSMCGDPEDLVRNLQATPQNMAALMQSRYGAYGPCYTHKMNQHREESFEIETPICVCALMPELVNDFYYERANCEEFKSPTLPPGRRVLSRNTENWYDPKKDWFMGFAQWNQDWFLYHNFFRDRILRREKQLRQAREQGIQGEDGVEPPGVYIDIGAMGAFELSNTAVFDQCFGWRGICVEPNAAQHYILSAYRSCVLEKRAVGRESGRVKQFVLDYSGSAGHLRERDLDEIADMAAEKYERGTGDATRFINSAFLAHSVSLEDLLSTGGANRDTPIDVISIDIEGGELAILEDFPFDKFRIRVFLIECDGANVFRLDILMLQAAFTKTAMIGKDHVYVSREFMKEIAVEFFTGRGTINPFETVYPPYINIEPYNDTFSVFQRRFLDEKFGG
ncbi:unnamed protein product [Amoebophrya sp. A25]|nr:unnamed protein product [Amoebophrya sp. A25]|eukprot:GSA25T00000541001.1